MSDERDFCKNIYEHHLQNISGIKFTRRQIDVMACLLHLWRDKEIARKLGISPNTVGVHLTAISEKLGSGGRQGVLDFINKSGKEKFIREYYQNLISDANREEGGFSKNISNVPPFLDYKQKLRKKVLFRFFIACLLFLLIFSGGVFLYLNSGAYFSRPVKQYSSVHSELPLPHKSVLLERSSLLKEIEDKFKNKDKIKTVVISGIGGEGKTTLARRYAKQQNENVVWEVNAETKESLVNSFEELAYALSETAEDKRELRLIRETEKSDIREKNLFAFIKKNIKSRPNWLLIYDNVESFSNIQEYFPYDHANWGSGKVIITTRDSNLNNNSYIDNDKVVRPGVLNSAEQLTLFTKILYKGSDSHQRQHSTRETQRLIRKIPPYPLDTSTAAYYIKDTKIPLGDYISHLSQKSREFSRRQKEVLSDVSKYSKTRYEIIATSLESIIKENPDSEKLLLFISLLDSQNIPKDLLESYGSYKLVDRFVHHLKRYSFITNESFISKNKIYTFSIHRIVQYITLFYLSEKMNTEKKQKITEDLLIVIKKYLEENLLNHNYEKIKYITRHYEFFLNNEIIITGLLKDFPLQVIKVLKNLGKSYRYMGNYSKSKETYRKALFVSESQYNKNHILSKDCLVNIGMSYGFLGKPHKAVETYKNALPAFEKYYGQNHPETAWVLVHLGNAYRDLGSYLKAWDSYKRAFKNFNKHFGPDHIQTAWASVSLASIYNRLGKFKEAEPLIRKALKVYKNYYGSYHVRISHVWNELGSLYRGLKIYDKSRKALNKVLRLYIEHYGENHPKTAFALYELGKLFLVEGHFSDAECYFKKSLIILEQNSDSRSYKCYEAFGDLNSKKLDFEKDGQNKKLLKKKVMNYYARSISVINKHFPLNSPHFERLQIKINKAKS